MSGTSHRSVDAVLADCDIPMRSGAGIGVEGAVLVVTPAWRGGAVVGVEDIVESGTCMEGGRGMWRLEC